MIFVIIYQAKASFMYSIDFIIFCGILTHTYQRTRTELRHEERNH